MLIDLEHHLYQKKIGDLMIRFDGIEAQETSENLPGVSAFDKQSFV